MTRTTTIPPRPTDRLYVDRAHLEVARDHLAKLAEPRDLDVEAEWQRIVAGFHDEAVEPTPPWPTAEEAPPSGRADTDKPLTDGTRVSGVTLGRRHEEPSLLDGLDTFGADLPDDPDDDEGYTPPPPPPFPRISKYAVLGVVAIIGGFALFLFPELLPVDRSITTLLGFTAILAGFVTLIWRLRSGDEEDYDPDDGAVV